MTRVGILRDTTSINDKADVTLALFDELLAEMGQAGFLSSRVESDLSTSSTSSTNNASVTTAF